MKFLIAIVLLLNSSKIWAAQSCSRVAYINYQEVLVDSSSSVRGDGLKFYLNRDPIAKEYLELYQKNSKPSKSSAAISTVGIGISIAGLLQKKDEDGVFSRNTLVATGLGIILVNLFVSKTMLYQNEKNLIRSIDEYNKRNRPQIYFSPFADNNGKKNGVGINFGYTKNY